MLKERISLASGVISIHIVVMVIYTVATCRKEIALSKKVVLSNGKKQMFSNISYTSLVN